jgi:hypothetical protein
MTTTDTSDSVMAKNSHLPFNKYQSNVYSQNGEDGVISEILRRLNLYNDDNWCVEFGAWNGRYLSNTFALVERNSFKAVYIEGEKERFQDLLETVKEHPGIVPICAYVDPLPTSENSLDRILAGTPIPKHFDLLSIDIDSYDLDVWESLSDYSPKIVVIEINSSIPPGIVWRHSKKLSGNSFTATCNVALQKGYSLVCHTGNLIFVSNDSIDKLNLEDRYLRYPELLFLFDGMWISETMFRKSPVTFPRKVAIKARKVAIKVLPTSIRFLLKKLQKDWCQ